MFEMGACMSSNNEEVSRKKHSQAIDKQLEEDSKRLRRECKILLLGTSLGTEIIGRPRPGGSLAVGVDANSGFPQVPARAANRQS